MGGKSAVSTLGFAHHLSELHPFLPAVSDHPDELRHLLGAITKNTCLNYMDVCFVSFVKHHSMVSLCCVSQGLKSLHNR